MADLQQAGQVWPGATPFGEEFEIVNEFAAVKIQRVMTRNGMRLLISSPRLGFSTMLDAMSLESLTWQPPEVFSNFLEQPFGPGGGH